jgi:hypothetical protein
MSGKSKTSLLECGSHESLVDFSMIEFEKLADISL